MRYAVDHAMLERTTRCDQDFICQKSDWEPCQKVTGMLAGMLMESRETPCQPDCPYRTSYGSYQLCLCPTRIEIYHKYGV